MTELEKAILKNTNSDIFEHIDISDTKSILEEHPIYISPTDKRYNTFMKYLGTHTCGDIELSVELMYDKKEDKPDGIYLSFNYIF